MDYINMVNPTTVAENRYLYRTFSEVYYELGYSWHIPEELAAQQRLS